MNTKPIRGGINAPDQCGLCKHAWGHWPTCSRAQPFTAEKLQAFREREADSIERLHLSAAERAKMHAPDRPVRRIGFHCDSDHVPGAICGECGWSEGAEPEAPPWFHWPEGSRPHVLGIGRRSVQPHERFHFDTIYTRPQEPLRVVGLVFRASDPAVQLWDVFLGKNSQFTNSEPISAETLAMLGCVFPIHNQPLQVGQDASFRVRNPTEIEQWVEAAFLCVRPPEPRRRRVRVRADGEEYFDYL